MVSKNANFVLLVFYEKLDYYYYYYYYYLNRECCK